MKNFVKEMQSKNKFKNCQNISDKQSVKYQCVVI